MNRCSVYLVLAVAVLPAMAGPQPFDPTAAKDSKIRLTPTFEQGATYPWTRHLRIREQYRDSNSNEFQLSRDIQWSQTIGVDYVVESIEPNGSARLNMVFRQIAMKQSSIQQTHEYDSQDDDFFIEDEYYRPIFKPIIGESLSFTLSADGTVGEMTGMEAILKKIRDSGNEQKTIERFSTFLSDSTFQYSTAACFGVFAFREVSVGDRWSREYHASYKDSIFQYRLASVDPDSHTAVVKYTAEINYKPFSWDEGNYRTEPRFATVEGTAHIDTQKGTILKTEEFYETVSDIIVTSAEGHINQSRQIRTGTQTGTPALLGNTNREDPRLDADQIDRTKKYCITREYRPGDYWRVRYSLDMDFYWADEQEDLTKNGDYFEGYDWLFMIQQADPNGMLHIQLLITRMNLMSKSWMGTYQYDSSNPESSTSEFLEPVLSLLVEEEFTFTIDPDGTVSNIQGLSDQRTKFNEKAQGNEKIQRFQHLFEGNSLRFLIAQYFSYFPGKEVGIGDTWKRTISSKTQTAQTHFTVKDIQDLKGRAVAEIHYTANVKHHEKEEPEEDITSEYLNDTMKGTLLIEIGTGRLVKGSESFQSSRRITYPETEEYEGYTIKEVQKGKQIVLDNPPRPKKQDSE